MKRYIQVRMKQHIIWHKNAAIAKGRGVLKTPVPVDTLFI